MTVSLTGDHRPSKGGTGPAGPPGGRTAPTASEVRRAWIVVAVVVAAGVATDLGLRGGMLGLGSTLALTVAAVGLVVALPRRTVERGVLCGAVVLLAAFLSLRTSPWILVLDWTAALGLLALAATSGPGRSVVGQSLPGLAVRAAAPWVISPATVIAEPIEVAKVLHAWPRPDRRARRLPRHTTAVLRGLLIAAPIVLVLGLLLGSADAVFASFFDVPTPSFSLSLDGIVVHAFLFCVGAGTVTALIGGTRHVRPPTPSTARPLGAIEATVVLGGLAVLYALFAVAQVVAATGGDDRVQRTTGLTYATYARNGFFQLLWAAGITLVVLLGIRALTGDATAPQARVVRYSSAVCCTLTLVLVGAAINRLAVYRDAYGLTMLRLACTTFAWFLGATFVLLAVRVLQRRSGRDWLPVALAATAVLALVGWNAADPEAHVARTNIDRAVATGKLDVGYADGMSDDAVPVLVAGLDRLPEDLRDQLRAALCTPGPDDRSDPDGYEGAGRSHVEPERDGSVQVGGGWAGWNRARADAAAAVEACAAG